MKPMLCVAREPTGGGWLWQPKLDGIRCIVVGGIGYTRSGSVWGPVPGYPPGLTLDGELVCLTPSGFDRAAVQRHDPRTRFVPFDAPSVPGPIEVRLAYLAGVADLRVPTYHTRPEHPVVIDQEGWVAKRCGSRYQPGVRSADWRKIYAATRSTDPGSVRAVRTAF